MADPSHVPFAHHKVQGIREQGVPIPINIKKSTVNLIEAVIERSSGRTTITFEPPCRLEYAISVGSGKQLGIVTYCIPVSPGRSRIVAQFPINFAKTIYSLLPRWLEHIIIRNPLLDGDMILLHQQERFFQQKKLVESWKTAYKLPTSADRLVIEFRNWFEKYCNGDLPWNEVGINFLQNSNINDSRTVLLDRYKQHTQHCSSCRGALRLIQRLQVVLLAYSAITISGVAILPDPLRVKLGLTLIITALLSLAAYTWLKFWLVPKFYFVDYVHAQK